MFYILNLLRRTDRKITITKRFEELDILDEFNVVEGIDGSEEPLVGTDNPRILATAQSHRTVWQHIVDSGPGGSDQPYGVVLEDDVLFHYDFKKHWLRTKRKINSDRFDLIYLGMGDCLPVHTKPPSLSLLCAQEKSHVLKGSTTQDYFGIPDPQSPYIFDWFGAFSYVLTKEGAQKLIDEFDRSYNKESIDRWIKNSSIKKHVTIPLLTYHPPLEQNMYDTDVANTYVPIVNKTILDKKFKTTAFLIVVEKTTDKYYLEETVLSILRNATNPQKVVFAFRVDYDDTINLNIIGNLRNGNYDKDGVLLKPTVYLLKSERSCIHQDYNHLWRCCSNVDFFVCWDWDKVISKDWDRTLNNYHSSHKKPPLACYQIQSNIERNVDTLNSENTNNVLNISEFSTPFLTNRLVSLMGGIGLCAYYNEYLKYVCYLSKITILVKDITSRCISDTRYEDENVRLDFFSSVTIKNNINDSIRTIIIQPDYRQCGMWIDPPQYWSTTKTIEESILTLP